MKIEFINHASISIELGCIKLLCDPWYFGKVFSNGWQLRYENRHWKEAVKKCTHLWISHLHPDHFHPTTLKKYYK